MHSAGGQSGAVDGRGGGLGGPPGGAAGAVGRLAGLAQGDAQPSPGQEAGRHAAHGSGEENTGKSRYRAVKWAVSVQSSVLEICSSYQRPTVHGLSLSKSRICQKVAPTFELRAKPLTFPLVAPLQVRSPPCTLPGSLLFQATFSLLYMMRCERSLSSTRPGLEAVPGLNDRN